MHRITIAAVAWAALALAACGSDDKDSSSSTPATTPAAAAPSADGTVTVSMKDTQFLPHDIKVKVGQKIQWTNDDPYPHNVKATKGADFASETMNGGDTYDYTATKAGVIDYVCTIHSGQDGTITVTK